MPSSTADAFFQSSLRSASPAGANGHNRDPSPGDPKLHRGCSGVIHGHGCGKVKSKQPAPTQPRDRACQQLVAQYAPSVADSDDCWSDKAVDVKSVTGIVVGHHHHHHAQQQQQHHHHNHHHNQQEDGPTRKKSMLGLGVVLSGQTNNNALPPRCPPPKLSYANRSLSSSTCSSSSSSRPSSGIGSLSGSPGIYDYNPMTWSTAQQTASWLEQVSEEEDDSAVVMGDDEFRRPFGSPIGTSSPLMKSDQQQQQQQSNSR